MTIEKAHSRLKLCFVVGGIVDTFMVIIFLVPALRVLVFGEDASIHTPSYNWAMYLVVSLGSAWTALLFWASLKPIERKAILFFTVFPLMFIAYAATLFSYFNKGVSLQFFILFTIITFAHCPYFFYVWFRARKYDAAPS